MSLLELRDLSVTYRSARGPIPAVRDVSLTLNEGESLGIAGESGCGKSSLAMAILRLLPRTAKVTGEVRFDDEELLAATWGRMRAVRWAGASIVFQGAQHSLNAVHRVGAQIAEPILLHSSATPAAAVKKAGELLEQVGLPAARARSYPHELSGGQRQRVVIAGALALDPQVLIADEPVASLDASVRGEILALLLRLRDELGLSALVVTHDLGLAWNIADRVAVMYLGRIVETGPLEQVLKSPQHPYTQALLSVLPESDADEPVVLAGEPPDPTRIPRGCRFHPRCQALAGGAAEAAGVAERCRGEDLPVLSADRSEPQAACHLAAALAQRSQ